MMMCHPTKFGCKKISSSIDMSETVIYLIIWALTGTLNLKTTNLFSCMTLGSMMVHHHTKFGYKRFSGWGNIVQMNIHWNTYPFLWPWTQHSSLFTRQSSSWLGAIIPIYFSCERISNSEDIKSFLVTWILHCDLDLGDSKPIFFEDRLAHGDALPYRVW